MKKGFTLVEILGIITAIGIIAIFSVPTMANYQKATKLRNEARLLATNLRYAQQLAITEQIVYTVNFDTVTDTYVILNTSSGQTIKSVTLDSEVAISQINDLTDNTIQFIPTGAVIESGNIVLQNTKSAISTIFIKPSGYVEINE